VRTVYLGTSDFAATVLAVLAGDHGAQTAQGAELSRRPELVVTRPDRPAGRGRKVRSPPVADTARELGIALAQPASVNDEQARETIAAAEPDVVVVCAFGALIKEPLLGEHEMLNVHPSLLPRWRGAAPIERAIMAGDEQTGVSIMRLTAGLDSGPVCAVEREPIKAHDTYGTLAPRLAIGGAQLLARTLAGIDRGEAPAFVEQDEATATYAEKIVAPDRLLDPSRPATELERLVRALTPHIGARVALNDGTTLGVLEARLTEEPAAGMGVHARDGRLLLGCADGALELLVVQPAGKRPMEAAAFLRGHELSA
jgi:methionyl-tRNA formyltransferase